MKLEKFLCKYLYMFQFMGQCAPVVGSRVILFGGEDMSRKLFNDVHILDLESMTWEMINTALILSSSMIFIYYTCK